MRMLGAIVGTVGAMVVLGGQPVAGQQDVRLDGPEGAVIAVSVPLDLTATESWARSRGRVDWERLLRPEGLVTNRSRHPVSLALFVVPAGDRAIPRLSTGPRARELQAVSRDGQVDLLRGNQTLLSLGGRGAPVLARGTVAAGGRGDLSGFAVQNQAAIGRMMAEGPVRLVLVGQLDTIAGVIVGISGLDLPLRPDAFPGDSYFPGDLFFPGDLLFPGDLFFPAYNGTTVAR